MHTSPSKLDFWRSLRSTLKNPTFLNRDVVGFAFGKIVSSFVTDIIMPPIGILLGGIDFSNLVITLKKASGDIKAVTLNYGIFINTVINFTIIAFSIFIVIKQIDKLKKKEAEKPAKPSEDIVLLREIRDSLKK